VQIATSLVTYVCKTGSASICASHCMLLQFPKCR